MKLRRLIQLTASVATAAVLSACGGGGDAGPQWAQDTKKALGDPLVFNVRTYRSECELAGGGFYSYAAVIVRYETEEGRFEQAHNNYYVGRECGDANLDVVYKLPTTKITSLSSFVDPVLGLSATREAKVTAGGPTALVRVGPGLQVGRGIDAFGFPVYKVTLSPVPGLDDPATLDFYIAGEAGTQLSLVAYDGNTLYWGDTDGTLDNDGFPTQLNPQTFTLVANTQANAPSP